MRRFLTYTPPQPNDRTAVSPTRFGFGAVDPLAADCDCAFMKIRIDKAGCVGNARCAAVSAELFPLDDDGYIAIESFEVPAGMEELARRGARACPERIIISEEDDGSVSWPPQSKG